VPPSDDVEPRANDAEERLRQLGPPPAKDAAPETAEIAVRSDLNCAIINRFREAAIEIPYPQRDLRWRGEKPHDGGDGAPPDASKRSS
jgi:hypothetical protein